MNKLIPMILTAAALVSCSTGNKKPVETPKDQLVHTLFSHVEKGEILYGHQDDLSYGHAWKVEDWTTDSLTRSDVKAVTGKYPAIVGFDLGGIEMGDKANLDSVDFGLIRKAALTHVDRGGIVTFSWHPRNPFTGGDAWDVSSDQVVKSLLEGGEHHDLFMDVWLKRLGDFLESLDGIPVIFRPWHENVASWFWWGGKLCTEDQYKELFRTTWTYLVKARGRRCPVRRGAQTFPDVHEPAGEGPSEDHVPVRNRPGKPSGPELVVRRPLSRHQGLPGRLCAYLAQRPRPAHAFLCGLGRI